MERVNHTMAQMLAMVCNKHRYTPITTPLAPPRALPPMKSTSDAFRAPPLTVFDRSYGDAHQNLDRDQLAYCDLACERQQRAYELVREQHALTVARVNRRPKYTASGWVWVYNTAATIRQGLRKDADNKVFKDKLSLYWTGPFNITRNPISSDSTSSKSSPSGLSHTPSGSNRQKTS